MDTGAPPLRNRKTARHEKRHRPLASPLPARDAQFIARIAQEVAHYNVPEHIRLSVLALIQSSPPRDDATQASGETGKAA